MERPKPILPVVASVVWLVGMIPALATIMMSAFFFDAPGSEDNGYLIAFLAGATSYPFLAAVSVVGSWTAWTLRPHSAGLKWAFAILPVLALITCAVAMGLLMVVCDGDFVCR